MGKFLRALKPRRPGVVKRIAYRLGARPHPGSLLYSPSLSWRYAGLAWSKALPALLAEQSERASAIISAAYASPVHEGETVTFPRYVQPGGCQRCGHLASEHRVSSADHPDPCRRDGCSCPDFAVTRESHRDASAL